MTHDKAGVVDCHEMSAAEQLVLWTGTCVKQRRRLVLQGAEGMSPQQGGYGSRSHI